MITAYASESRPLKQKTLSDFHWQYDNNASHGSIEWANMNSDQHVEMTKQFLMGKTIFEKTVSATQGNHPTPPKYMYNFKTMKQKNTATDFERDIRIVDNSALPLPPVVHTAKPMVARRVISNVTRRSEFHRHSDNWPTQLGYHGLGGHWLGEDCYNNNPVLHGLPPADYSSSDDLLKYFKWRPLPKLSVNKALVDYYSFDSAKLRFAHFMNIVKNQEKIVSKGIKVFCFISFRHHGRSSWHLCHWFSKSECGKWCNVWYRFLHVCVSLRRLLHGQGDIKSDLHENMIVNNFWRYVWSVSGPWYRPSIRTMQPVI